MMKNLFTSPLWDAARAVEATTLSLMTGEKAAALSRAMGELTYVGREVYKEENWQKLIIEMLSMDLWVKKGAGQQRKCWKPPGQQLIIEMLQFLRMSRERWWC